MNENKNYKDKPKLNLMSNINYTIAFFGGLLSLYLIIKSEFYSDIKITAIYVLFFVLIIIINILYKKFNELKQLNSEYNSLVDDYNDLINESEKTEENRAWLISNVKEKDKEIKELNFIQYQKNSTIAVLFELLYRGFPSRGQELPVEEDFKRMIGLNMIEVEEDE